MSIIIHDNPWRTILMNMIINYILHFLEGCSEWTWYFLTFLEKTFPNERDNMVIHNSWRAIPSEHTDSSHFSWGLFLMNSIIHDLYWNIPDVNSSAEDASLLNVTYIYSCVLGGSSGNMNTFQSNRSVLLLNYCPFYSPTRLFLATPDQTLQTGRVARHVSLCITKFPKPK